MELFKSNAAKRSSKTQVMFCIVVSIQQQRFIVDGKLEPLPCQFSVFLFYPQIALLLKTRLKTSKVNQLWQQLPKDTGHKDCKRYTYHTQKLYQT